MPAPTSTSAVSRLREAIANPSELAGVELLPWPIGISPAGSAAVGFRSAQLEAFFPQADWAMSSSGRSIEGLPSMRLQV
jgi:hypothetical protein